MNIDLHNCTVLITRPKPAGEYLCLMVESHGGKAVYLPVIEFGPPSDIEQFTKLIKRIDHFDWLIFISVHSVRACLPVMLRNWPVLPANVKIAAVGAATANVLKNNNIYVNALPQYDWSSEGLLALPVFQDIENKKIAIIRGGAGREALAQTLQSRGAAVTYVEAYQRQLPNVDPHQVVSLINDMTLAMVICASFESIKNLITLLEREGQQIVALLKSIPLVVPSERIKKLAQCLNFQTIWVARNATDQAFLEVIQKMLLHTRKQE